MPANQRVFGIYENLQEAQRGIDVMRAAGYRDSDFSILCSQDIGGKDLAIDESTKAPEGIAVGAGAGAILGGALGWLTGIGTLMIPGAGPFLAAGPLVSVLSGIGIGGTVGGLTGALIGGGIPEFEAQRYADRLHGGQVLLSVRCDNSEWANKAVDLLRQTGAEDISGTSEAEGEFDISGQARPKGDSADEHQADFRKHFESFRRDLGAYEEFGPVYAWGFRMAKDPHYANQTFEKSEPDLKRAFSSVNPSMDWEKISSLVLYGWEQAGGRIEVPFAII